MAGLLNVKQVADLLGVTKWHVRRMLREGRIKSFDMTDRASGMGGRFIRVHPDAVNEFLEAAAERARLRTITHNDGGIHTPEMPE